MNNKYKKELLELAKNYPQINLSIRAHKNKCPFCNNPNITLTIRFNNYQGLDSNGNKVWKLDKNNLTIKINPHSYIEGQGELAIISKGYYTNIRDLDILMLFINDFESYLKKEGFHPIDREIKFNKTKL